MGYKPNEPINVDDDDAMLDAYGWTKKELRDALYRGEDIGGMYDGDPIELLW